MKRAVIDAASFPSLRGTKRRNNPLPDPQSGLLRFARNDVETFRERSAKADGFEGIEPLVIPGWGPKDQTRNIPYSGFVATRRPGMNEPAHFAAVTTTSTICGGSRSTPMQARIGGLAVSTHSSQARFISLFRVISVM